MTLSLEDTKKLLHRFLSDSEACPPPHPHLYFLHCLFAYIFLLKM